MVLKNAVQQKLKELYLNIWNVEVDALSKCLNYMVYKKEHKLEKNTLLNCHLLFVVCIIDSDV